MGIIQSLLNANIPVIVEESNEDRGEYSFGSMSLEQREKMNLILGGWNEIRVKRDRLLIESDWTQTTDVVLSLEEKISWSVHRQTLRDIPQTYATPEEVVWPEKPGGA